MLSTLTRSLGPLAFTSVTGAMASVPPKRKTTAEQRFAQIFAVFMDKNAPQEERDAAERKIDEWLKRHGKTRADIGEILTQARRDDAAATPPPPPSDPRDSTTHHFDSPKFTPAGVVEGIFKMYVTMQPYALTIFTLWICFTHVYEQFAIAPRVALISDDPDSGKTTAKDVAGHLVWRPNPESLGTGAAISEFIDQGPCTILLDELDQIDNEGRRRLHLIWNLGHKRGAKHSLMIKGKRKLINLHAPMLAAGVGGFLGPTQKSRTFIIEMEPFTAETKPERDYNTEQDFSDLDHVYAYLRHWARDVKLDPRPAMPRGVITRYADNIRGLLAIADSCGTQWGERAREAISVLYAKEGTERPQITIVRHGLMIFETLGVDKIRSVDFNRELKRLDLPDAKWTRYRGASGTEYARPNELHEQARLLHKVGIHATLIRFPDGPRRGYRRAQFEDANRKASSSRGHLQLVAKSDV
jgi:hypothetical protein